MSSLDDRWRENDCFLPDGFGELMTAAAHVAKSERPAKRNPERHVVRRPKVAPARLW